MSYPLAGGIEVESKTVSKRWVVRQLEITKAPYHCWENFSRNLKTFMSFNVQNDMIGGHYFPISFLILKACQNPRRRHPPFPGDREVERITHLVSSDVFRGFGGRPSIYETANSTIPHGSMVVPNWICNGVAQILLWSCLWSCRVLIIHLHNPQFHTWSHRVPRNDSGRRRYSNQAIWGYYMKGAMKALKIVKVPKGKRSFGGLLENNILHHLNYFS